MLINKMQKLEIVRTRLQNRQDVLLRTIETLSSVPNLQRGKLQMKNQKTTKCPHRACTLVPTDTIVQLIRSQPSVVIAPPEKEIPVAMVSQAVSKRTKMNSITLGKESPDQSISAATITDLGQATPFGIGKSP